MLNNGQIEIYYNAFLDDGDSEESALTSYQDCKYKIRSKHIEITINNFWIFKIID